MTPMEAVRLLGLEERISQAESNADLREEIVNIKLELYNIIRKAKKLNHPDVGGNAGNFRNIDNAAKYLAAMNVDEIASGVSNDVHYENIKELQFCRKCNGTSKFRNSICPECQGKGVNYY